MSVNYMIYPDLLFRKRALSLLFVMVFLSVMSCDEGGGGAASGGLVSRKFISSDEYRIVCRGYPLKDSRGLARIESARRAARLSAEYYAGRIFDSTVKPARDGEIIRYRDYEDFSVIYFVITKKRLRNRLKNKP